MNPHVNAERHRPTYPVHSWYVAATSEEVTGSPLGRRALGTALVLYRTAGGAVVVLEDRDAHRPYPLSLGRVEGDLIARVAQPERAAVQIRGVGGVAAHGDRRRHQGGRLRPGDKWDRTQGSGQHLPLA